MNKKMLFIPLWLMAAPALSQSVKIDMTPGLWESKVQYTGDSAKQLQQITSSQMDQALAEMKKQFANMPPEQRKQMEALMEQSGLKVDEQGVSFKNNQIQMSGEGVTVKNCITQAQIDRGELANDGNDNREGCDSSLTQIGKNRYKSTQICGDDMHHSEMTIEFNSPKHYTGSGVMKQTVNGQQHTLTADIEGRWLGSDCGDIDPS